MMLVFRAEEDPLFHRFQRPQTVSVFRRVQALPSSASVLQHFGCSLSQFYSYNKSLLSEESETIDLFRFKFIIISSVTNNFLKAKCLII